MYLTLHLPPSLLDGQHISSNSQVTPLVPPQYSQPKLADRPLLIRQRHKMCLLEKPATHVAHVACGSSQVELRFGPRRYWGGILLYFSYVFYLLSPQIIHFPFYTFLFYLSILPSGVTAPPHSRLSCARCRIHHHDSVKSLRFGHYCSLSTSQCGSVSGKHLIRYCSRSLSTHLTRRVFVFIAQLSYEGPVALPRQRQASATHFLPKSKSTQNKGSVTDWRRPEPAVLSIAHLVS